MSRIAIDLNEAWPLISEVIESDGEFRLYPRGTSMMPLIREGIDSVLLVKARDVSKNDMVFYKRENGQFVLHRAVKIKKNSYVLCGDNQFKLEKGIRQENVLAVVKGFYRDELYVDENNEEYRKYLKSLPKRRRKKLFSAIGAKIKRIFKK